MTKLYSIQAPDGRVVDIRADSQAEALAGAQHWVAVNPKAAASRPSAASNPYAADARSTMGQTPAWAEPLRQFARQATLGASEAIPAAVFAGSKVLQGGDFGQAYAAGRDAETAMTRDRASPINTAAGVVGALATPVPVGRLLKGVPLVAKMTRGALAGAGLGATSGALNAQSLQAIPQDAALGAGVGGALGGGVPLVGAIGANGYRALNAATGGRAAATLNSATGGRMGDAAVSAANRLKAALQKDGASPEKIADAVADWRASGATAPALLDVAGENTRALLRSAASKPGPGRSAAVAYAERTRESMQGAAIDRARALTPDTRPAGEVVDALTAERAAQAKADYAPAYAADVPIDESAQAALSDGPGQAAIRSARADAIERMEPTHDYDRLLAGDFSQPVSGASLDRIRIAMGERGGKLARAGNNSRAAGSLARKDMVENTMSDAPGIDEARANFKENSGAIEAVDHGKTILQAAPDEFAAKIADLTPKQAAAAQVGARQALTDALGQPANASPVLRKIAFAENMHRNLHVLFGPEEAQHYIDSAGRELEKTENANFISPNTGSQTQIRGTDDAATMGPLAVISAIKKPLATAAGLIINGASTMTEPERGALISYGLGSPSEASTIFNRPPTGTLADFLAGRAVAAAPGNVVGALSGL